MDTLTIEKLGLSPLKEDLNKIKSIKDIPSLLATIGYLHSIGTNPGFSFYVGQDDKNSAKYAVFLGQGGLGMGNRDYYFNTDKETVNIRNEYVKHLQAIAELMGNTQEVAKKNAISIMKMETELAKNSRKLEVLRDPIKNYNKMSVGDLNKVTPNVDWKSMTASIGIKNVDTLIVGQPEFYKALNQMIKSYSIEIFDRWGAPIFASSNMEEGWDGIISNSQVPAPVGVYVFKLEMRDYKNRPIQKSGSITLLR
jgi:putative endopeptidase